MNKNFDDATGRAKFFENVNKELGRFIDPVTGKVKAELVEQVPCPVCDSTAYEPLFTKQGFDFVRCANCTLVYVNPRLLESATLAYYGDASDQQSMVDWLNVLANPANQAWQIPYFQEAVDILAKSIPANGKILDIGCSIGLFMEVAHKSGFEASTTMKATLKRSAACGNRIISGIDARKMPTAPRSPTQATKAISRLP